jgi:CheY-like chemotaxis protein
VAVRGADVVRQLMTYAGREGAEVGLVDVSQTIREMQSLLKVSVSKHALLELRLGHHLPFVRVNAPQLQQVVMNLVTNASDSIGHREGVIRVTTRSVKVGRDSWAVSHGLEEGDYVQLEVSDNGCGMPPEMQARVFDPYFTTKSAGHGLGLSIIYGIVRGINGAIRVMSAFGKGTTFQILLPRAGAVAEEIGEAAGATTELARQLPRATVLVVEDEDPLRQGVVKMLRRAGLEVFEAGDGSAAIDLVRANVGRIGLILLDFTIPGASSTEVIAEARRTWPHIGVILTSAYSREMLARALSEPQVRGFIRKPYQLADLVRTIRNVLLKR